MPIDPDDDLQSPSLARLHPQFKGDARVSEMIRSFWPFTRGTRSLGTVQIVLSVAFFVCTALLPLQIGNLLSTALSSAQTDRQVRQYVLDPAAVQRSTQTMLKPELATPEEIRAAALAITATEDQIRLNGADELLDALFPHGLTYRTKDLAGIDEPTTEWELTVSKLFSLPRLSRTEVEDLRDSAISSKTRSSTQAFAFTVNTLLVDQSAKSQREDWRNHRFTFELARFGALVGLIVVLRVVALLLAQRSTLSSARRLQDAIFARVHDTALVDAGALARPSMVSRCSSYVDNVQKALLKAQTEGVADLAALVLSVGFLVYIDRPVALLMIGVIALFEITRHLISGRWSRTAHERLDLNTSLSEVVDGAIAVSDGIRATRTEAAARGTFSGRAQAVMRKTKRLEIFGEAFRISAFGLGQFSVLTVIAIVGFARRDITLAHATAVVLYVREVASSLERLPGMIVQLQETAPYMRRLRRVLAAPLRRVEPVTPQPFPVAPVALTFDHVGKVYPDDSPGCEDVSFTARRGSWTYLVGTSGSGISSVLELATGLEHPNLGTVSIDVTDLSRIPHATLSEHLAVLPEFPSVFEGTVAANLTVNCGVVDEEELERVVRVVGLEPWVGTLESGLQTLIGLPRRTLDIDIRVRLTLARMVLSRADVVILVDPSRYLDREVADELWALMHRTFEDRLVLASTERLDRLSDEETVLCFRSGTVLERGTVKELRARDGLFTALWKRFVDGAEQYEELAAIPALAGLSAESLRDLSSRLVTERFAAGETVFSTGSPAERVYVVVDGVVDVLDDAGRSETIRTGSHFGDMDAQSNDVRTSTARARTDLVVRSLHRLSISRGLSGILDRPDGERVLFTWLTRHGSATRSELNQLDDRIDVNEALTGLLASGMLLSGTDAGGETTYRVSGARRQRARSTALLDSLFND